MSARARSRLAWISPEALVVWRASTCADPVEVGEAAVYRVKQCPLGEGGSGSCGR